jgi:DNA-binding protein H-NS
MKIDVDKLSLRELDSLLVAAERRKILLSRRRPVAVVRRELIALADSLGYTIDEVIEARFGSKAAKPAKRRKRARPAARYRDPENKRQTWSGLGRMPRWLAEKTRRGQSVADFLIPGLGRPTAKKSGRIGMRSLYKQG